MSTLRMESPVTTEEAVSVEEVLARVAALESRIRAASVQNEKTCSLDSSVSDALRDAGCFRLFRPRTRGGLALDPVSAFRVVEALARMDSAAGWNVALANAFELMGAWLSDETTEEVFGPPDAVMAGAFFPPRRAVPVEGGYRLSGRCPFNSNYRAATWLFGEAHVYDDGVEQVGEDGLPVTLLTVFPKSEATLIENWDTLGMRGTGSHDVEVNDLFVPAERAVRFQPLERPSPAYAGPAHRLTIWPAVAINAVPALGIAQAAIDAFADLAADRTPSYMSKKQKESAVVQLRFAKAVAKVESARAFLHDAFDTAWQGALDARPLDMEGRARLQLAASNVTVSAAEAVKLIHSIVGTAGIRNDQVFQRHFRDVHVITQHAYFCESRMEAVGQVHFGLEPDWGFLYF